MPAKEFEVDGIGTVHIYRRKGARHIRLSITADGKVRLTIPYWTPYAAGLTFVRGRSGWIGSNRPDTNAVLRHGDQIGKAHRLMMLTADVEQPVSRIAGSEIRVIRPKTMPAAATDVQMVADKASIRALRLQATKLLPGRLQQLASSYGFIYGNIQVKRLKGRWGSCDQKQNITLNLFLMQLPWHLIDYVLLHELVHTKHMNHGPAFWNEFLRHEPNAKLYRTEIKTHKPILAAVAGGSDVT